LAFNISGQKLIVCCLVDESISGCSDKSNARGIMIVKNMHKCHKHHAILHKLCTRFGKNELRLYLNEQKFLRLGGGRTPLNTPMYYLHTACVRCYPIDKANIPDTNRTCHTAVLDSRLKSFYLGSGTTAQCNSLPTDLTNTLT